MKFFTKQKKLFFPDFVEYENEQITDKLEIANRFNMFFTNIGKNLANKLVNRGKKKNTFKDSKMSSSRKLIKYYKL